MTAEQIACVCHEANRAYCTTLGDHSQVVWNDAPAWQKESAVAGVVAIMSGQTIRPEQSHESWLADKERSGWKYGPVKDVEKREHPCFVPYAELPFDQQRKDHLFFAIAKAMIG